MNLLEHLNIIDKAIEKENYEKKKNEIFSIKKESADELYVKSCGAADDKE